MKTGIFGGTFDPIHIGHLISADQIRMMLDLDQIVFIPSANPPHKPHAMEPAHHRFSMIEEAIQTNKAVRISSIELVREGVSYSVDTVTAICSQFPGWHPLYFILGIDAFMEIESWKNFENFLSLITVVVTSRPGFHLCELSKKLQQRTLDLLNPIPDAFLSMNDVNTLKQMINSAGLPQQLYLEVPAVDISATEIRVRLKKNLSVQYLILDSVKNYIDKYALYR